VNILSSTKVLIKDITYTIRDKTTISIRSSERLVSRRFAVSEFTLDTDYCSALGTHDFPLFSAALYRLHELAQG